MRVHAADASVKSLCNFPRKIQLKIQQKIESNPQKFEGRKYTKARGKMVSREQRNNKKKILKAKNNKMKHQIKERPRPFNPPNNWEVELLAMSKEERHRLAIEAAKEDGTDYLADDIAGWTFIHHTKFLSPEEQHAN